MERIPGGTDKESMAVLIPILVLCMVIHARTTTADPCLTYDNFTADSTRSPGHVEPVYDNKNCDAVISEKWYRLVGDAGTDLTNDSGVLVSDGCGTTHQIWMDGTVPDVSEGIVDRQACVRSPFSSCHSSFTIQVKNCCSFRVYYLKSATNCPQAYCVSLASSLDCFLPPTGYSPSSSTSAETTTSGNITISPAFPAETTTSGSIIISASPPAEITTPGNIDNDSTSTKATTFVDTTSESVDVTTQSQERSFNPVVTVLAVVSVLLLVLLCGLLFALYRVHNRHKDVPDSRNRGNTAIIFSNDMDNVLTKNNLNSHYEQVQSISLPGHQSMNNSSLNHYSSVNPKTEINDMYLTAEETKVENNQEKDYYYELDLVTIQKQQSPYDEFKLPAKPNLYENLSENVADSNYAPKSTLNEADTNST